MAEILSLSCADQPFNERMRKWNVLRGRDRQVDYDENNVLNIENAES